MSERAPFAPGWPGISPKWTSSAKTGVGTALSAASRGWFTLSHGIVNEIYFPRLDHACTRDLGFVITDGDEFFSEEKRHATHTLKHLSEGVPAYQVSNTCNQNRYRVEKEIIASPRRDALLQRNRFTALARGLGDYHLYVLLAPHLGNRGSGNTGYVGDYKGVPMLFAVRDGYALALACSAPWLTRSVGFVGVSDGWQDLSRHKRMAWNYSRAENGNVALTGEVNLGDCDGSFVLAVGFGNNAAEAGHCALASLTEDFDVLQSEYAWGWQSWHRALPALDLESSDHTIYPISLSVLRAHEATRFPGGTIASLSIPWGFDKGDEDLGGYHLVWPRDLVEAASGLLAAGAQDDAYRVIRYLQVTQESDGHWPQNMWTDGTPFWNGVQMDETALPILLVDQAQRAGTLALPLGVDDAKRFWPMVRRAAGYIVRNGPVTPQERWEMDPGYSPFTLAAEVAALLAAADLADLSDEPETGGYLRETADNWNANIESWTYVTNTELDGQLGLAGHYVRIAPPEPGGAASPRHGFVPIKSSPANQTSGPASDIVSPDALALVRFGLRPADDPRILDTLKAIDATLKVDTPFGPAWRRYVDDRYGEHEDGTPFDGSGIGRAWPLLTGERAHYELAAGQLSEARKLRDTMHAFANEGGMIPEQIWNVSDIPERQLFLGRPTGSAMPLVWAHAEYIKLCRSLDEGRVFDMPPQPVERYIRNKIGSPYRVWRFNNKCETMLAGKTLRIELLAPATVHWTGDDWSTVHDNVTRDTRLGIHLVDLDTKSLPRESEIIFTFYWPEDEQWEGSNFVVRTVAETG